MACGALVVVATVSVMSSAFPLHPWVNQSSVEGLGVNGTGHHDANNITVMIAQDGVEYTFKPLGAPGCPFPTCGTHDLASRLQFGDETAGSSSSDPWGNGKK